MCIRDSRTPDTDITHHGVVDAYAFKYPLIRIIVQCGYISVSYTHLDVYKRQVVFFAYWMLGRKKMNSTRVTLLLVLVGILAYNLKVFA